MSGLGTAFPDARADVSRLVCGPVLDAYQEVSGPDGALGLPESDEQDAARIPDQSPGHRQQVFEYGVIDLTVATGETEVFRGQGFAPIT